MVSKDVLKSFRNLPQSGDGTSAKKLDEDLDILWVSNGGNGNQKFWFVFRCEGKILLTLFGSHIFHMATEKKISVASWRLPKKVNFGPWNRVSFFTKLTGWLKISSRVRKPGIAISKIKKTQIGKFKFMQISLNSVDRWGDLGSLL